MLRQTGNNAGTDRIGNLRKYDRYCLGRRLHRTYSGSAADEDDVQRQCHQFHCRFPQIARLPAILDLYIATIGPPQSLQFLEERLDTGLFRTVLWKRLKHTNAPHPLALLRARRKRPRRCAAKQRDELAPSHSITSSARPDKGSGTVMPSALAVLRLRISSTFVACTTGRSAGFSPLRTRPVYTPA